MNTAETPDISRRIPDHAASKKANQESNASGVDPLAEIAAACRQGNMTARRQLYDACSEHVYRVAARVAGQQDAADVTQQVFLQAFRSIDKFDGRSRIETWLHRIAVNEALQHLRRNRRHKHSDLDWEPAESSETDQRTEQKEALERALANIDPELKSIFLLREVEDYSYHDIAESLHIPEGTVGSRLNRARRDLKRQLQEMGYSET
ncbi:RNA polymerase sigma factor [Blastopirellula marina]|uniref:RNA polymerase subunit sigma-24 n=1 Tax=Blastopirellula marina TaxID=124 RepID=A0A2S8GAR1_9BACT|nr:RNA polymerase sigma factor [Blastopirellula marina]PQO26812.1 RNA polymerase subunit sigma-24 [Blastopirellula marina]PQO41499.1 RNA polymerase subunit sigma-24 [Blastopirellula marina]PTL41019.1 RNA polymerase sigma factor [Blastopirellula marina]